jgi:serine/threonine-protein kinase
MATQSSTFDSRMMLASGSRVIIVVSSGPYPTPPRAFADVPDVVGANQGKALSALQDAGLVAQVFNDYSEVYKRGEVIGQLPIGGASVPTGAEAVLLVSSGPATTQTRTEMLPDVVGRSEAEAVSMLQAASFSPQVAREHSNSVPAGTVISQLPSRASLTAQPEKRPAWVMWAAIAAAVVVLAIAAFFLFRPSDTVVVPDVTGLTQEEAVKIIEDAGLEAKVTEAEDAGDAEEGTVVEQKPPAGTEVPPGSEE